MTGRGRRTSGEARRPRLPRPRRLLRDDARRRSLLRPAREALDGRLLPVEPLHAVVGRGDRDGGDHVFGGHAARGHGDGREERRRGELAVVVDARVRHAHRLLLREALAAGGGRLRRRGRGAALLRAAGGVPARLPRRVPGAAHQHPHHGVGQPRDGEGARRDARRLEVGGSRHLPAADVPVHRCGRLLGGRVGERFSVPLRDGWRDRPRVRVGRGGRRHGRDEGEDRRRSPGVLASGDVVRVRGRGPVVPARLGRRRLGAPRDHVRDAARVSWWASWYPGAEPGGGGYVAQNMLACRDERHSRAAALYFNVAHYAMRSWPWLITALCSLAIYGGSLRNPAGEEDPGLNYVQMMVDFLPVGLRGFMLASFAAAFMSTQATQMNWGSSYLVNDLYRRFLKKGASERHYVLASRIATALTLVLSLVATTFMSQISKVWEFLLTIGAGTGLVYILRWYWWRVNAWSEVAAMASALVTSLGLRSLGSSYPVFDPATPRGFAMTLVTTTAVTTAVWLAATFATAPEPREKLAAFYAKVRPAGPGWKRIAGAAAVAEHRGEIPRNLAFWALGTVFVYSIMFVTGALLFGDTARALVFGAVLAVSGALLFTGLAREKT